MQQQYAFRYLNSQSATNYYSTRIEDYLISMFTCTFFFSAVVTMMVVMMWYRCTMTGRQSNQ